MLPLLVLCSALGAGGKSDAASGTNCRKRRSSFFRKTGVRPDDVENMPPETVI